MNRSFDTLIGILNGAIGDKLASGANPLATNAGFYHANQKLSLKSSIQAQLGLPISNKIIVFLHGLTNTESIWDYPQRALAEQSPNPESIGNYGSALHASLGYTPFFVRYNSGLPIEENGKIVNKMLSELFSSYPHKYDELVIVGFSMGGLISRLAQSFGENMNEPWFQTLQHAIYIGTPHEGAPLEKFADAASSLLSDLPQDYFSHWADWINLRSAGIKDLKHGLKPNPANLSSKQNNGKIEAAAEHFGKHAKHSFISGALSQNSSALLNKFFGDSLVREDSANPSNRPEFSHSAHFDGLHHLELAHSPSVFHQMETWLKEDTERPLSWANNSATTNSVSTSAPEDQLEALERLQDKAAMANAAALLAAQAYLKALDTVEIVHNAISKEPYSALNRVPAVNRVSTPIEQLHLGISDTVFSPLRLCGTTATSVLAKTPIEK